MPKHNSFFKTITKERYLIVFALLIFIVLVVGAINPDFIKGDKLSHILDAALIISLIAMGEMFVLLTRGIDVSVGASMGTGAIILGLSLNAGLPALVGILFALTSGAVVGALNGLGVGFLGIAPIIMTLGTMGVLRGSIHLMTGGNWIDQVPAYFKALSGLRFLGISYGVWLLFIITTLITIGVHKVKFFRNFYYVGDNREGAFYMGVPASTVTLTAYVLSGVFAALGGVFFVSQVGFIPMQAGAGQEMKAIAACVLGGISLMGGVGTPLAALAGALFLTAVDSILVYLKVPAYWSLAIAGGILLIVVLIDFRIHKAFDQKNSVK